MSSSTPFFQDISGAVAPGGRVLRPAEGADVTYVEDRHFRLEDVDRLVVELSRRSQGRLNALRKAGVELEQKLRQKTEESRARIHEAMALAKRSIEEQVRVTAEKAEQVLADRHREGFVRGEEDGFRKGYEEGLAKGLEAGRREGLEQGRVEAKAELRETLEHEVQPATECIREICRELTDHWEQLARSARGELLELALAVARAVIRREVGVDSRSAVESCLTAAAAQVVADSRLTIEIHPSDREAIEAHLADTSGSLANCPAFVIVERNDLSRGGCRLVTNTSSVDRTIETQLEVLESRVREAAGVLE